MKINILTRVFSLSLLLVLFTSYKSLAQLGYQEYAALPEFDMFTVSPNGEMFAYRNTTSGKQMVLIYSRVEGKAVGVFDVGDINLKSLDFLTDNFLIMEVSEIKRIPGYPGRHELSTAMAYDISEGDISQLLQLGDVIFEAQTGLGDIVALGQEHQYVYMPAFIGGNLEEPEYGIVRVNLELPKKPRVIYRGYNDSRKFFVNREGEVIS